MTSDELPNDEKQGPQASEGEAAENVDDNSEPQVLAIARLNEPFSRRGLMRGMASAASALAVGSVASIAVAQRRDESTGEAHVQVDLRAFSDGIRSIHALGDGVHVAAVSSKGQLRVWHLDRPSDPLNTGQIQSVRGVATGLHDELVWMSGTTMHFRRMASPRSDVWSRRQKGVETLLTVASDAVLFSNIDRELIRLSLAGGEQVGPPSPLPVQSKPPEQLIVALDGTVWIVAAGCLHRRRPNTNTWEEVLKTEAGTIMQLDPLAERMVVERNGIVQLVKLPGLEALGKATVIPADEAELRPVGGYSTLKRPQSNPSYEPWLRSRAELSRDGKNATVTPLDGKTEPKRIELGPEGARALSGLGPPRGYAWGDSGGRMGLAGGSEIGHGGGGRSGAVGGGGGGGIPLAAPGASVSKKGSGACACGGWAGNACTCNTVSVKAGEAGRSYSMWDSASQRWVHRTISASEKLPEGAVCTCNTVALGQGEFFRSICSCHQVCTCNPMCTCEHVCTCEQVCTCQGHGYSSHYWYPN